MQTLLCKNDIISINNLSKNVIELKYFLGTLPSFAGQRSVQKPV